MLFDTNEKKNAYNKRSHPMRAKLTMPGVILFCFFLFYLSCLLFGERLAKRDI